MSVFAISSYASSHEMGGDFVYPVIGPLGGGYSTKLPPVFLTREGAERAGREHYPYLEPADVARKVVELEVLP